jgi:hypothetical protein
MLGWFWYRAGTTLEEMEWMLARAAGWNAGYALVVHPGDIEKNPNTEAVIQAIRTWEEAKNEKLFSESQKAMLKAGEYDFSLYKIGPHSFHLQHYRKLKFEHENLVLQPGQPHYSEWEFEVSADDQPANIRLRASGEEGEISEILLELDGAVSLSLPASLKAGYSCIVDGSGHILLYDDRGSLKKKFQGEWGALKLAQGPHSLRVSCNFNGGADLKLEGVVKLKDRIEIIAPK